MSKFWSINAQRGDSNQQYCIMYPRAAERLVLKYPQPQKEMIIMWPDRGVSYSYSGNCVAMYKCIKSTWCTPQTHTMFYVDYSSIQTWKKEEGNRASWHPCFFKYWNLKQTGLRGCWACRFWLQDLLYLNFVIGRLLTRPFFSSPWSESKEAEREHLLT